MSNSTLVIIPTYNEVENLPLIIGRVLAANDDVDVLVVDDNSPDGTGDKADELAAEHDEVNVLHRRGKEGLMAAYRAGFRWALERDYQVICQMDADGSHAPEELSRLIDALSNGADLAIGSRYVDGGEVKNWPKSRYLLSKLGNRYVALALGDEVGDMTAGYRAFRREVLEQIDLDTLSEKGYIFQVEVAHRVLADGFDVREVPITFEDRKLGESKLDPSFAVTSLAEVTKWGASERVGTVADVAKQMASTASYEYRHSALPKAGAKVKDAAGTAANAAAEMAKVGKYELAHSKVSQLPSRAASAVKDGAAAVSEFTRIAVRELRK